MHKLMNHYMGKFSTAGMLRSPPGEQSNAGGGDGNEGGGDDSNGDGTVESGKQNKNQSGGDGNDDDDDDSDISDLLGDDGDVDEEDFDFVADSGEYEQTDEEKQASQALGTQIEQALKDYAVADADIPEDFDPTDRASLKTLLSNTQRGAIQSTMKMMIPVINHALGVTAKQMKHYMDTSSKGRSKQSAAIEEFKGLGISDPKQISMAKPIYAQALRAAGGDAKKAAKATRRAFAAMGVNLPGSSGGGGSRSNNSRQESRVLSGNEALDTLFGKSK